MNIKLHRIYDDDKPQGYQVLVDRIWPRGISKEEADLDDWWKIWHQAMICVNGLIMIPINGAISEINI